MRHRMTARGLLVALTAMALGAVSCTTAAPEPTPTPERAAAPTPPTTPTRIPTSTPLPLPSPTPTEEPSPTPTPDPNATPTPTPFAVEEAYKTPVVGESRGAMRFSYIYDPWQDTNFEKRVVDMLEFTMGGAKDGIPAIVDPEFVSVDEASEWLNPDEPVILFEHNGDVRAYPFQILIFHEIVNDTVGGKPVVVTF